MFIVLLNSSLTLEMENWFTLQRQLKFTKGWEVVKVITHSLRERKDFY